MKSCISYELASSSSNSRNTARVDGSYCSSCVSLLGDSSSITFLVHTFAISDKNNLLSEASEACIESNIGIADVTGRSQANESVGPEKHVPKDLFERSQAEIFALMEQGSYKRFLHTRRLERDSPRASDERPMSV